MLNSSHHLQSTPLLHEYSGPSVSAMLGSIPGRPFLELCQVPAAIPLESLQGCRICDPSSEASAWGRGKSHRGTDRVSMGDQYHVVFGQKLRHFNPLPVQFKALLHGQKGCVFFSGHLNLRTAPETGLPSREKNHNN